MLRTIEIKQSVFADNNREADSLRAELKDKGLFLLNLMSSPGSGKTTTLVRTIEALKDELRIGIMEADIDSDVDAHTVQNAGAKAVLCPEGLYPGDDVLAHAFAPQETKQVEFPLSKPLIKWILPRFFNKSKLFLPTNRAFGQGRKRRLTKVLTCVKL